jgi:hypothetical protein
MRFYGENKQDLNIFKQRVQGLNVFLTITGELVSLVSIVTDSGVGDRGSIPDEGGGVFLYPLLPAGSGAQTASCTVGTGYLLRGLMWPGRAAYHSPPSSAEVKKE